MSCLYKIVILIDTVQYCYRFAVLFLVINSEFYMIHQNTSGHIHCYLEDRFNIQDISSNCFQI